MKKFKQICAFFLAFVMMFGLLPGLVFTTEAVAMTAGDEVLFANYEGTADNAWSKKALDFGAYWDNENLYVVYDKAVTGAVTINGKTATVTAGDPYNTAKIALADLGTAVTNFNQDIADVEIKIGTTVDWTGWLALRREVKVTSQDSAVTLTRTGTTNVTKAPNRNTNIGLEGPIFNVVEVDLTINSLPTFSPDSVANPSITSYDGIAILLSESNLAESGDKVYYSWALVKDASNNIWLCTGNNPSIAPQKKVNLGQKMGSSMNIRIETIPQTPTAITNQGSAQWLKFYVDGELVLFWDYTCYSKNNNFGSATAHNFMVGLRDKDGNNSSDYNVVLNYMTRSYLDKGIVGVYDGTTLTARTLDDSFHTHSFTEKKVEDQYLKTPASGSSPAVYWKSCSVCGAASTKETDTFTVITDVNNVLFAKYEGNADDAWANRMGGFGAYWDDENLYVVYDKSVAGGVSINDTAATVTAGATYNTAALPLTDLGTTIANFNQDIANVQIKIGTAVDWTGCLALRRQVNYKTESNFTLSKTSNTDPARYKFIDGLQADYFGGPLYNAFEIDLTITELPKVADLTTMEAFIGNFDGLVIFASEATSSASKAEAQYLWAIVADSNGDLHFAWKNSPFGNLNTVPMGKKLGDSMKIRIETTPADGTVATSSSTNLGAALYVDGVKIWSRDLSGFTGATNFGTGATRRFGLQCSDKSNNNNNEFAVTVNAMTRGYLDKGIEAVYTGEALTGRTINDTFHVHLYTEEVAEDKYLKTPASVGAQAVYYKSCSVCGKAATKDADTFKYGPMGDSGDIYSAHLLIDPKLNGKIEEDDFFLNGKLSDDVNFGFTWNSRGLYLAYNKPATDAALKLTIAGKEVTVDAANVYNTDGDYIEVKIPWDAVDFKVLNYGDKTTLVLELGDKIWNGEIIFTFGNDTEKEHAGILYPRDTVQGVSLDDNGKISFKTFSGTDEKTYIQTSHAGVRLPSNADLFATAAESVIEFDFTPTFMEEATGTPSSHWTWKGITFAMADDSYTDDTKNAAFVFGIMNRNGTYQIAIEAIDGGVRYYDTGIPSTSTETMHLRVVVDNEGSTYTSATDYSEIGLKIYVNGLLVADRQNARAKNPNGLYDRCFEVVSFRYDSNFKYLAECTVENIRIYKAPSALLDDVNVNRNPNTGDNGIAVFAALLVASMTGMALLMVPTIRKKLI